MFFKIKVKGGLEDSLPLYLIHMKKKDGNFYLINALIANSDIFKIKKDIAHEQAFAGHPV